MTAIKKAFQRVFKLKFVLFTLTKTFKKLFFKFQSSIIIYNNCNILNIQYFRDCELD